MKKKNIFISIFLIIGLATGSFIFVKTSGLVRGIWRTEDMSQKLLQEETKDIENAENAEDAVLEKVKQLEEKTKRGRKQTTREETKDIENAENAEDAVLEKPKQPEEKTKQEREQTTSEETKYSSLEDIIRKMPKGRFIFPDKKIKLGGDVDIKNEIEGASSVEFFLRKPESLTKIYLGKAASSGKKQAD